MQAKVAVRKRKPAIQPALSKRVVEASKAGNPLARSLVRVLAQNLDFPQSSRAVMPVGEILLLGTFKMGKVEHNLQVEAL